MLGAFLPWLALVFIAHRGRSVFSESNLQRGSHCAKAFLKSLDASLL